MQLLLLLLLGKGQIDATMNSLQLLVNPFAPLYFRANSQMQIYDDRQRADDVQVLSEFVKRGLGL